jgi:MFS family permease
VQAWWQLLVARLLAALGIGGEWAVGASLLSETWPLCLRPWIAAVLQSAVDIGIVFASCTTFVLAAQSPRVVFLVGVLPALNVLWVRREVPETEERRAAKRQATDTSPGILDLLRGEVRRTTILTILVCSVSLSAHWSFFFWYQQDLRNLPDLIELFPTWRNELASIAKLLVMAASWVNSSPRSWPSRSATDGRSQSCDFLMGWPWSRSTSCRAAHHPAGRPPGHGSM